MKVLFHRSLQFIKIVIILLFILFNPCQGMAIAAQEYPDSKERPATSRGEIIGKVPEIQPNGNRVILLMIDGLAVRPFQHALDGGNLPNISNLMKTRANVLTIALSTFPSATSPSVPEFISGHYADLENLTAPGAVHAFDREKQRVIRYITEPDSWQWPLVTLFDATRHLPTITVFEGRWDGPRSILTQLNMAKQAVFDYLGVRELAQGDRGPVEAFINALKSSQPPYLSLVVLNEFDMAAHFYGPESEQAITALSNSDKLIGEIIQTLAHTPGHNKPDLLAETNFLMFGDHGHVTTGQFVDLVAFFKERGLRAYDVSTVPHVLFRERLGKLWTEWPDIIMVSGGSNITQLYFRQPSGSWNKNNNLAEENLKVAKATINLPQLISAISKVNGVNQVLWSDDKGITHIFAGEDVSAKILVKSDGQQKRFAYVVPDKAKQDPFAYLASNPSAITVCRENKLKDSCFKTRTEWIDSTFETRYPGAVILAPKAFLPERFTGDLMVTLKPGYSFMRDQKGDHGNLERDAVLTPLIINGPAITPCTESHYPRLVDIFPTVAVLLGTSVSDPAFSSLDGRVLDCVKPKAQ